MDLFDINRHFEKFNRHKFFNQKTYGDLYADVLSFSTIISSLTETNKIALKIKSPYLTFVATLTCLKEKKLTILLSHLESDLLILKMQQQISFDTIIEDHHVEESFGQNHFKSTFPSTNQNMAALVIFSSGTTSAPKAVALSFNNLYYSSKGFSEFFNQTENECSMINLPHHHVGGQMILWRSFFSGGRITDIIYDHVDYFSLVPMQLKRMIEDNEKVQLLKNIRVILVGGAPLSLTLKDEAKSINLNVYETYGMSETTSNVLINGVVLPYRSLEIDEHGFFKVIGKTLAIGYFQKNRFVPIPSSWFITKDQGFKDNLGLYHFIERKDLIFISGGENINPLLIEDIVKHNSLIKDAYLVSLKDEKWGEIGILLYETQLSDVLEARELNNFLRIKLHPYQVPKFIFQTEFHQEGHLKLKRNELKIMAENLYLKNIFTYDYFEVENAPLIVFFHGFLGDKDDLKNISYPLDSKYSRLFIDLPGHGQTKIENFYSQVDLFSKLSKFIQLFSKTPIYYGYSMGGRIALHLALNYLNPTHLILESAGIGLENFNEQLLRQNQDFNQFAEVNQTKLQEFLNSWYQNPIFKTFSEQISYKSEIEKKSLHDFKEWKDSQKFLSIGHFPLMKDNLEKLSTSKFSLLYIYGEKDLKYKNYAQILQTFKRNELVSIYEVLGTEHNPHRTHPLEITKALSISLK